MCGIFGLVSERPHDQIELAGKINFGLEQIRHRGPDGQGTWLSQDGKVALGHVRLTVIDLETGAQPMPSDDGRYEITYNGEVYNYIELRNELGNDSFRTTSDTEVILRAFQRWGEGCVEKLRGMFAFAIWDKKLERLFVARDRFGIKPFYWAKIDNAFYFGSEIKALTPFLPQLRANKDAVADYFAFQFCLGSKTLTEGVNQLLPAHSGWLVDGEFETKKYWDVDYGAEQQSEGWYIEKLRSLLDESVDLHLRADVEVGAYASGGVDSSLLASLAQNRMPSDKLKIFNGRFLDGAAYDESQFAHELANENGMELFVKDIDENDFANNLPKIIWHLDQPIAGPGSFPQYMVSEEVSKHVKVVLGGQGGDEIFGGYTRYLVGYLEACLKSAIDGDNDPAVDAVPFDSILTNLRTVKQYKPLIREFWSDGLFDPQVDRYWRLINRANKFDGTIESSYLNQPKTKEEFSALFLAENVEHGTAFDRMTHLDFKTLLPALLQVEDRMSMAHGVEARVPFLDHPLIEFAASIPNEIKYKNGELKRMLKLSFAQSLPTSILERKDKMGFPVPLNDWLKKDGQARQLIGDVFSSNRAGTREYLASGFDVDGVLSLDTQFSRNLWALLGLEIWQQESIDNQKKFVA